MSVNPTLIPRFRVNPETVLEPVALVADAPLGVVAGPGTRATTLRELIEEARQKRGDLTYASASNGSASTSLQRCCARWRGWGRRTCRIAALAPR
jgi:tripartite-type tricarboxylate transporter receptor subunit TctC